MSANGSRLMERAAQLRRAFDDSFARAAGADQADRVELLAVRVGPDAHAIRLSEIAGLFADRRIVPVPGPLPELLGIVSLRGAIVPVYDLRRLLGYPAASALRWLVLAAAGTVALAFDRLDSHVVVSGGAIVADPGADGSRPHMREVVDVPDGRSALLSIPSLVDEITARARRARPAKER